MNNRKPVRWIAAVLVIGLLAGCGGGFSKKTKPPVAGEHFPQQKQATSPERS